MSRNVSLLLFTILASFGICRGQYLPKRTGFSNSSRSLTSPTPTTASSADVTTIIDCEGLSVNFVGLNSYWTQTYNTTVATVVSQFIRYNNTVVPANATTISATGFPGLGEYFPQRYFPITTSFPGVPTDLAPNGGGFSVYAQTVFEAGFTGTEYSWWIEAPATLFVDRLAITYARGTRTEDWSSTGCAFPSARLEQSPSGCSIQVPSTSWSGSVVTSAPSDLVTCVQSKFPTAVFTFEANDCGPFTIPLASCSSWYMGGQPTVHVPVTQLTSTSYVTILSNGNYGSTTARSSTSVAAPIPVTSTESATYTVPAPTTPIAPSNSPIATSSNADTITTILDSPTNTLVAPSASQIHTEPQNTPQQGPTSTYVTISLAPGASAIIVNGVTSSIAAPETPSQPALVPLLTVGSQAITANAASQVIVGQQTLSPGGSALTIDGSTISLPSSGGGIVVNGATISPAQSSSQGTYVPLPLITIGSAVITPNSASQYVVGSQTIAAGGPAITIAGSNPSTVRPGDVVVAGSVTLTPGHPAVTVGGSVINPVAASQYLVGSQTISAGGPAITVDGTTLSLASGGTAIVVNGATTTLASPAHQPAITVGSSVITQNTASQYIVGSQTLSAGGPAITVEGTTLSLASAGTAVVINGVTSALTRPTYRPVITVGSSVITQGTASQYVVGSQTLAAGSPAITVDGTTLSLAPAGTAVIVNGVTSQIAPGSTPRLGQPGSRPQITVGSSIITQNPASQYIIGTQTLSPGGPALTVDGTTLSLAPSGTAIIINGITSAIATPTPIGSGAFILPSGQTLTEGESIVIDGTTYVDSPSGVLSVNGRPVTTGIGAAIMSGLGAPTAATSSAGGASRTSGRVSGAASTGASGGAVSHECSIWLLFGLAAGAGGLLM